MFNKKTIIIFVIIISKLIFNDLFSINSIKDEKALIDLIENRNARIAYCHFLKKDENINKIKKLIYCKKINPNIFSSKPYLLRIVIDIKKIFSLNNDVCNFLKNIIKFNLLNDNIMYSSLVELLNRLIWFYHEENFYINIDKNENIYFDKEDKLIIDFELYNQLSLHSLNNFEVKIYEKINDLFKNKEYIIYSKKSSNQLIQKKGNQYLPDFLKKIEFALKEKNYIS